jgi:transposase
MAWRGLTKAQWEAIRIHLPPSKASARGGRPRLEDRRCFEGSYWILLTGAQWCELPRRYGSSRTCWWRLKSWEETAMRLKLWRAFLAELNDREKLRWDECFVDGSFIPAQKGGPRSARRNAARVQSGWCWSMARVLRWEQTWVKRLSKWGCYPIDVEPPPMPAFTVMPRRGYGVHVGLAGELSLPGER